MGETSNPKDMNEEIVRERHIIVKRGEGHGKSGTATTKLLPLSEATKQMSEDDLLSNIDEQDLQGPSSPVGKYLGPTTLDAATSSLTYLPSNMPRESYEASSRQSESSNMIVKIVTAVLSSPDVQEILGDDEEWHQDEEMLEEVACLVIDSYPELELDKEEIKSVLKT